MHDLHSNSIINTISPYIKQKARIMPFVTFPLTKICNFKCQYCGYGGELSASMKDSQDFDSLQEKIFIAHALGVRKFRLTGGEPLLYPKFDELISLFNDLGVYLLINTNGSLINKKKKLFNGLQKNINFAISLDTLNPVTFDELSGTKNQIERVKEGIDIVKNTGNLYRLNMVVNQLNKDDIFEIINYCSQLNCDLKLLDVVSVPLPYGSRKELHYSFNGLEKKLTSLSKRITEHIYARSFGTPCKIYEYSNVKITVKSTWNGSHYDMSGICNGCKYFPCHEGLYDIFVLPDDRVVGCRWSEKSVEKIGTTFEQKLINLSKIFQRSEYHPRSKNLPMKPKPSFVINSLKRAKQCCDNN